LEDVLLESGAEAPHSKKWCFQGLVSAPEVGEERGLSRREARLWGIGEGGNGY